MKVEILSEDQAVKGYDFPIAVNFWETGAQLTPVSGTITVKDPSGTAVVSSVAMTLATKTLTYTLAAANLDTLWENAIIEIDYLVSTTHFKAVFFFDCVLNMLKCNVIDADLKNYAPLLADELWSSETNYDRLIQEAFRLVKRGIKDKGRRPFMIIDGAQIRELIILKTFELITFDFAKSTEDIWWARYEKYRAGYDSSFEKLIVKYDEDQSGTIEADEEGPQGITMVR
jgi:hypothetical protein